MTERRRVRIAVIEFAVLLLFVGAGFAASVQWRRPGVDLELRSEHPGTSDRRTADVPRAAPPRRSAGQTTLVLARAAARPAAVTELDVPDAPAPEAASRPTAEAATRPAAARAPRRRPPVSRSLRLESGIAITPRSVAVVQVPVPAPLAGRPEVAWLTHPAEDVQLLSRPEGTLPASAGSLTLVVRAPESAPAGRLEAASIIFSDERTSVETVVSLEVVRIHRPVVRIDRGLVLVPNGDRVSLRGTVSNQGNGVDTLDLSASVPAVLDASVSPRRVVLRPGESRQVSVTVRHRDPSSTGGGFLVVTASATSGDAATSRAPVDVAAAARRQARGPYLQLGAATVLGDSLGATPVLGASIFGTYHDNIQLFGQAVRALDRADVNTLGLARVGYSLNGAFLSASAPTWRGRVGTLSERATVTTGEYIFGVGASGAVQEGAWDASAIFATSPSWVAGEGKMVSASAGYTSALGRGNVTASSLRDGFAGGRSLDAVGLGMQTAPLPGLTVGGELAYRAFNGEQGIGAAATSEFHSPRIFGRAELAHTPGGTAAFATSTDRVSLAGGLRLDRRVALQASGFRASDRATGRNPSTSKGVGAGIATDLRQGTTLDLSLAARSYETEAVPAGFGNEELTVKASLRTRLRGFLLNGYAGAGRSARTLTPVSGTRATVSGARQVAGASATLPTADGSFGLAVDYESNAPGTGFLPRALSIGASANQIKVPGLRAGPRVDLGLQYYNWFETRPAGLQIRVGTDFALNDDYRARVVVERDPFIRAVGSSTPWVLSLRIDRGFRLPSGHRPGVRGLVYVDQNANGQRDAGEEPLSGVRVRRGNEFVTTDRSGRFEFDAQGSSGLALDPLSLPEGHVPAAGAVLVAAGGRVQLSAVPTAPLHVRLRYQPDSLGREPTTRLDRITVTLTDTAGIVWALQPDSSGTVTFDALPPGRYAVAADLANLPERLRLLGSAPTVAIRPGESNQDVVLTLAVRPVRIFNVTPGPRDAVGARRR